MRKVLRAEERVCLHPEAAGHPSHAHALHRSLRALGAAELTEPRAAGSRRSFGAHLVERDFGLAGCKQVVQSGHVRSFAHGPGRSWVMRQGSEVRGAGGGRHAAVEVGARGPHGHSHSSRLEA